MTSASFPSSKALTFRPALTLEAVFAHAICISCLILQRFGATMGSGSQLPVCLAVAPAAFGLVVLTGRAKLSATTSLFFVLFCISALTTCFLTILYPDFAFRLSLTSFYELVVLYGIVIIRPTAQFDARTTLPVFVFWARVIAVCGICQYVLQFAHLRLFSFSTLHFPPAILLESTYHTVAPLNYGSSIYRSNGFFLLEPSILSQIMAIACVTDGFMRRKYAFLPLYAAAMLVSFSGTGILILALAAILSGLASPRQLPRVAILLIAGIVAVAAAALVFPQQFETLASRANPNDPSAQARYVEQLRVFDTLRNDPRLLLGFGPGAADGFVRLGSLSAVSKLVFDYGAMGASLFAIMLLAAWIRTDNLVITIVALLAFQFGGGYLLFPSLVLLLSLLCTWSRVEPSARQDLQELRAPWARVGGQVAT